MSKHETYMRRCLELAEKGRGSVSPNPMVGAVLVYNDAIIGEGYHKQYGQAHAEVNCISSVSGSDTHLIEKSILYVSLEPCVHFGKTPPCTDLIIDKKIPEVVIGCRDSYKEVAGKGIQKLQSIGVKVVTGVLEKEAIELNKRFFTYHEKRRPYVILKWAQTNDRKIAGKDFSRILISNELTNKLVHKWRSEEDAIMVGTNTALHDDPSLTTRNWPGKDPVRIVVDLSLKLPVHLHVFDNSVQTVVFNSLKDEHIGDTHFCKIEGRNIVPEMLDKLYELKIQSVLIEGGQKLLQSFIDAGLWDEARIITNEELSVLQGIDAPVLKNCHLSCSEKTVTDRIDHYLPLK